MNIKIYTYSDPYKLASEPYWDEIKDCAQFCASQTMVNGMNAVYKNYYKQHQLATVSNLVNALYYDWEKINTKMKQLMEVDAEINNLEEADVVKRALSYNMKNISDSIRLLKELNITPSDIKSDSLSCDQMYLYRLYKGIYKREFSSFDFSRVNNEYEVDDAVVRALKKSEDTILSDEIDRSTIVIHGVFQFTPSILAAIEDISRFKNIILIFNYQPQYKEVYSPWIRIYSEFEKKIDDRSNTIFKPSPMFINSYPMNKLADCIGKLYNGEYIELDKSFDELEVIEFDNTTQFAGYIADIFEKAVRKKKNDFSASSYAPTISFMSEYFYSTSSDINNLLRSYFPEQFGDRHFLDYPVGHFFVSIINMWDIESNSIRFENLSCIRDCLTAGILEEKKYGQHINTFNQISAFLEQENTLDGIISRLAVLKKCLRGSSEERRRIEYFQVDKEDLMDLTEALNNLKEIIEGFFCDFSNGGDNFRRFYKRISEFIKKEILDSNKFDKEMHDVVSSLLKKIETSDLPDTGTLVCLKETMNYYLSQEETSSNSANWIVHDFEQIDGDILRTSNQTDTEACYHFCQLSDKGVCSGKSDAFPWPLDINFFSVCCDIPDWKYIIYLKSRRELKYFRRYALVYGLEFLRNVKGKLSYVKEEECKENDLYFMLRMFNVKVRKYTGSLNTYKTPSLNFETSNDLQPEYSEVDEKRWNICKYRFGIESLIQNRTIYRNKYLIQKYLAVLLENETLRELQGTVFNESAVREKLLECYDALDVKFRIANEYGKTQLIYEAMTNIIKNAKKNKVIRAVNENYLSLREDLLYAKVDANVKYQTINEIKDKLDETERFNYTLSKNCTSCSCKDVCLQYNFDDDT